MFFGILSVCGAVLIFGVGIYSMLVIAGSESDQEAQQKPIERPSGGSCRVCGVLETAHYWITGHQWSV